MSTMCEGLCCSIVYASMLYAANIYILASHRHDICRRFFRGITQPSSCLHYLYSLLQESNPSLHVSDLFNSKISKSIIYVY